ncbi:hypothetical protein SAMN05216454_10781 [Peptostreptococcus russellii]|uniref:DUF948 domain-containing protein n=1 Tax=Peptostreptococcus russellii TaxID=215200 RepID=A0A1H8I860_9FIRM|nr:hypothetical protein [Peptostreptococcus russellii]SEN64873.1 hypothetical protein SAMN05216454_10781 [Peptostreptococcus russellii]
MSITVNLEVVLFVLVILGCIALIFLIIVLKRLSALMSNIDMLITQNTNNVGLTIAKLPGILSTVDSVLDNAKDVTDVAVDVSADVLTAKEKVKTGLHNTAAVANIIKTSFRR